jgi:hypothetical protein
MNKKIFLIIIIAILILGNVASGILYFLNAKELLLVKKQLTTQQTNTKVLYFAQLFVDKVLLGEGTVSFEDRLKLENAVRDISDTEIFDCWQRFANSQSDASAQTEVGKMFSLLINKIYQK